MRKKELMKRILVLMLPVAALAFVLLILDADEGKRTSGLRIKRNGYGEGQKEETLYMKIEGENEEEVTVKISPRRYGKDELQTLFQKAEKELKHTVLGKNRSAKCVSKDLCLVKQLEGYPFTISWELSRYDVVDMSGRLNQEEILEKDPEQEGILLTVTGILRYESEERTCSFDILVFSDEEGEAELREQVKDLVEKLDEQSREAEYVTLPESVDGKRIVWSRKKTSRAVLVFVLGVIGSILLICQEKQKKEKQKKEREEQMLLDYPEIISQFTMLMGAGMTAKNVWKKIAEDYQYRKQDSQKERPAYEEILYSWKEMQSGVPEMECYVRFARRCDLIPYMRLGVLLSQNLKKGSRGIADMLHMEAIQAMEDRKGRARRLGEEAGTKLLIPMLMMLVIVLAIVIVPAFLSIQM